MSVKSVDVVSPPMTVKARPFEIRVPDDVVRASGTSAMIVANAVIRIGRSRVLPASIKDSRIGKPRVMF